MIRCCLILASMSLSLLCLYTFSLRAAIASTLTASTHLKKDSYKNSFDDLLPALPLQVSFSRHVCSVPSVSRFAPCHTPV